MTGAARDDGHWAAWHEPYDDPESPLAYRLRIVRQRIAATLDRLPAGPVRAVSLCAGQGRDLLGVLATHPRRADVRARLVELDPANHAIARRDAGAAGLDGIEVVLGDASSTTAFAGAVPADLVLACGIFGNVVDDDVRRTIELLPLLCAAGATVVWTRHRRPPDLTPAVRGWFSDCGFVEEHFDAPDGVSFTVGVHRLVAAPAPFRTGERLFTFVGDGTLPA